MTDQFCAVLIPWNKLLFRGFFPWWFLLLNFLIFWNRRFCLNCAVFNLIHRRDFRRFIICCLCWCVIWLITLIFLMIWFRLIFKNILNRLCTWFFLWFQSLDNFFNIVVINALSVVIPNGAQNVILSFFLSRFHRKLAFYHAHDILHAPMFLIIPACFRRKTASSALIFACWFWVSSESREVLFLRLFS